MSGSAQSSHRGLGRSASDPGLIASRSLKAAGFDVVGDQTTTLHEQMKAKGMFRDNCAHIRPSGVSITIPLADSVGRNVQPEVYFQAPPTPIREKRFRKLSQAPGEIHVHHGLKEQKLPGDQFSYGIRGIRGNTTEATMKAGELFGVAEYKNSVKERIYESVKKEPLGKPHTRGHSITMRPEGFGKGSAAPEGAKNVIFPVSMPRDTEEHRKQYKRTHNNFDPGEKVERGYNWPQQSLHPSFAFGTSSAPNMIKEGAGAKIALNASVEDCGNFKRTNIVQRVCEDYRNVEHPKLATKKHMKQGASGPPMSPDHAYGIKSTSSEYTAGSCIRGYYSLPEQFPDMDLGRCVKPGRRNVTNEERAFGTPSVRTDVAPPEAGKKGLADMRNYGDEFGAAALLNPQRFDDRGVPDQDFLLRRPMDELRAYVEHSDHFADVDFDLAWDEARDLFQDGRDLVSLDAFLFVYSRLVDAQVHERTAGDALKGSAAARLGLSVQ